MIHTVDMVYTIDMVYTVEMREMRGMKGTTMGNLLNLFCFRCPFGWIGTTSASGVINTPCSLAID